MNAQDKKAALAEVNRPYVGRIRSIINIRSSQPRGGNSYSLPGRETYFCSDLPWEVGWDKGCIRRVYARLANKYLLRVGTNPDPEGAPRWFCCWSPIDVWCTFPSDVAEFRFEGVPF